MTHYRITQTPDGKYWVIVSPSDPELIWCGSHWGYADQSGGKPLISFPDQASAEKYAALILGGE